MGWLGRIDFLLATPIARWRVLLRQLLSLRMPRLAKIAGILLL